jgi:hypothetical protein
MKITLMGAGGEVTGAAYMVQTHEARVLVDCGLFQGSKSADAKNRVSVRTTSQLDAPGDLPNAHPIPNGEENGCARIILAPYGESRSWIKDFLPVRKPPSPRVSGSGTACFKIRLCLPVDR